MQPEQKVNILLVDDNSENLLALEAILDGLGQHLVKTNSGEQALRCLLKQDFAVILLDVQMPGMDGFETAKLIRERERSRHTPIIFLTAFSTSDTLVHKGYSLGAVDYLFKPIEQDVLTSKVGVFVELFKKAEEVKRQAAQLQAVNAELRESEERFRSLSACSPVGIFLADIEGYFTYMNPRCQAICGFTLEQSDRESWLRLIHPEQGERVTADWSAWTQKNQEYSDEFRLRTQAGIVVWVHVRSSPMLSAQGELIGHAGTVEDITERKQAELALYKAHNELEIRVQERTAELTKTNAVLQKEIARRKRMEVKLREAIKEAQDLYNNAPCGYHCLDKDGTFVAINNTALNFLGYTRHEVIQNLKFSDLITIESLATFQEAFSRLPEQSWIYDLEVQMVCKDGTLMPVILNARAIKDAAGQYVASRSTIFDITERKQAEDQIKASLQEKEVLLKEIHHRVKNNLQIVSGLLYLQSRYIEDEPTLQVLQENRSRIQSMALIHEKLYGSKNFDKIDFKDYIYSLLQHLFLSYGVNTDVIALRISIEPVGLDIDTAIYCGLIINELVLNTLKHAFPTGQPGEITVEFHTPEPNSFELIVSDNGVGFTEELDFQNQKSLGLRLVHSLVTKQLEGTIELDRSQGATFKMCWQI